MFGSSVSCVRPIVDRRQKFDHPDPAITITADAYRHARPTPIHSKAIQAEAILL